MTDEVLFLYNYKKHNLVVTETNACFKEYTIWKKIWAKYIELKWDLCWEKKISQSKMKILKKYHWPKMLNVLNINKYKMKIFRTVTELIWNGFNSVVNIPMDFVTPSISIDFINPKSMNNPDFTAIWCIWKQKSHVLSNNNKVTKHEIEI